MIIIVGISSEVYQSHNQDWISEILINLSYLSMNR